MIPATRIVKVKWVSIAVVSCLLILISGLTHSTFLIGTSNCSGNTLDERIIFPEDAGVLNVKAQFGAKGDGISDDTPAIQAALNAYPNGRRIIYLPKGIYLVSDTLNWPAGRPGATDYKNTILQGENEKDVIIKLRDKAVGYTDPKHPKAVIFTGSAPAQRFGNSIRNITIDTGSNNEGAIGIRFNASNQGVLRNVTIQASDGLGFTGLDMFYTDEIGPLLVKALTVKGCQYGISTGFSVNSQTFEDITLKDQSVYGFRNEGQVVNIENLESENAVPAIFNANGGQITLINSKLTGKGNAATKIAIDSPTASLMVRNVQTAGYRAAIHTAENTLVEPVVSEFVSGSVQSLFSSPQRSLNLLIRSTPTVPWDRPSTWANVVSYGAKPDDNKDDTAAVQAAIDSGKTTVYFPAGGTFEIQGTVLVRNNVHRILGTEANVKAISSSASFKVVDGKSQNVIVERMANGYDFPFIIDNASSRTLILKDLADFSGSMTGKGDVFIEDVVGGNWKFGHQNSWARQFNVENAGIHITNNGGHLWILGLKTERGGTIIDTKNSGKTELLGGFIYTTTPSVDGSQNDPMFVNNESSISLTFKEINYGGGPSYTSYVREIRDGITRNLPGAGLLSSNDGHGKSASLYAGYEGQQIQGVK
jgi:hypothetical protein